MSGKLVLDEVGNQPLGLTLSDAAASVPGEAHDSGVGRGAEDRTNSVGSSLRSVAPPSLRAKSKKVAVRYFFEPRRARRARISSDRA